MAIVFARYMMLALEQRKDQDHRTHGEIFFFLIDELPDFIQNSLAKSAVLD